MNDSKGTISASLKSCLKAWSVTDKFAPSWNIAYNMPETRGQTFIGLSHRGLVGSEILQCTIEYQRAKTINVTIYP